MGFVAIRLTIKGMRADETGLEGGAYCLDIICAVTRSSVQELTWINLWWIEMG